MSDAHPSCPQCGAALASGTVRGLCPKCLAHVAVGGDPEATLKPPVPADDVTRLTPKPGSAATAGARPASGDTVRYFGDYELIDEIARGGMGVVFKARQVSLNRTVALKMILAGQFANDSEVKRFRTEAEAAANLQHPNIVAIHEVGEHDGRHYFSMDYVEGRDLAQLVKAGPLPVPVAARYVQTIAGAIAFAHQRGTLHRDLKPHNVLIDQHDQPRITDFGLAKLTHQDSSITQEGAVMGSPSYMPPEQAAGRQAQVGPHSDVYAMGAVLYHLLTGRAPFIGATAVETLRLVMDEEPIAPTKLNAKVPADLETIYLKCLRKEPAQRYATAQEVADELGRFLNYEPIHAKPAGGLRRTWNWTQKNPWVFAATFALLLLVMAGVAFALWEKSRFLAWRLKTGINAPLPEGESAAVLFFKLFPGVCLLLYLAGNSFRKLYRQNIDSGASLPGRHLFSHGALGVLGTVVGMGHLFLQIRSWVWLPSPPLVLTMELAGVVCALVLNWMAVRMVWEAVGIHETSRFRDSVDSALGQQLAVDAHRWSGWRLLRLVLWMLLVGGTAFLVHEIFVEEEKQVWVGGTAGLALGFIAGWFLLRAIRYRLRLLSNLFAPAAVASFVVITGALALARGHGALALVFCSVPAFVLGALGQSVFGAKATVVAGQPRRFPGHPWRDALAGLALFLGLFVLFHLVENWRGHREWQRVKAELEAKGESLDYDTFLKPPVPDDQNVMAHPYMKKNFIKGSPMVPIVDPPIPFSNYPYELSDLKNLPRRGDATMTLLSMVRDEGRREVIPLLQFTKQPLADVATELAQRAGLKVAISSNDHPWSFATQVGKGKLKFTEWKPTLVSKSFTNVTALQALERLSNDFLLSPDSDRWRETQVLALAQRVSLQDIHDWYARYGDVFAKLEEAFQRPHSRLQANSLHPWESPIPNFVSVRMVAQKCAGLCKVHLLMGDADAALKDLRLLRRSMDIVPSLDPPTLVEAMIKVAIAGMIANTIEETTAAGLWPASHMEGVQKACEGVDLFADVMLSWRGGERAAILRQVDTSAKAGKGEGILSMFGNFQPAEAWGPPKVPMVGKLFTRFLDFAIPDGWVEQNKAHYARTMQVLVADTDLSRSTPYASGSKHIMVAMDWDVWCRSYRMLALMTAPNFVKGRATTQKNQTWLNLAQVALVVERHRAAKGAYPDTLAALVPEFAAKLPPDLFDGQPLRYRRTPEGKYVLYSVGPDSKDDGGNAGTGKDGKPFQFSGGPDWVWQGVPKK